MRKEDEKKKEVCARGENQTIPVQCGVKRNGDEFLSFFSHSLSVCFSIFFFFPFFFHEYTHQRRRTKIKKKKKKKKIKTAILVKSERERERENGGKNIKNKMKTKSEWSLWRNTTELQSETWRSHRTNSLAPLYSTLLFFHSPHASSQSQFSFLPSSLFETLRIGVAHLSQPVLLLLP